MNPRRVHELMRQRFPEVKFAVRDWVVAADRDGLRFGVVGGLVDRFIPEGDLLVEVHRRVGNLLPRHEALQFIADHVGQGEIRLTDREFNGFVVVALNGVATGWHADKRP